MVKSSRVQQLEDEMKVIAELQKNSNESIDATTKHYGFSRQKVWRIIKQWEERQSIWGYTAIVDAEAQGFQKFILSVKRSHKTLDKKIMNKEAYDKLEKIILNLGVIIESSYFVHGEYDWILIFMAQNIQYAKKFADILFNAYPGLVDKVDLSQILFIQRDHRIANPDQSKLMEFL
jgi:DNA-binding Lrp family transcriptional regulator